MASAFIRTRRSNFLNEHHPSCLPGRRRIPFVVIISVHARLLRLSSLVRHCHHHLTHLVPSFFLCLSTVSIRCVIQKRKYVILFHCYWAVCGSRLLFDPVRVGHPASLNSQRVYVVEKLRYYRLVFCGVWQTWRASQIVRINHNGWRVVPVCKTYTSVYRSKRHTQGTTSASWSI